MNNIEIRERKVDDAKEFCMFLNKLDGEAEYMLFEKGERNPTQEKMLKNIESVINDGNLCYIGVEDKNIIGFIIAIRENHIRTKHIATIVVGILEEYCNKGIGKLFFENVFTWADKNNIKKLELSVMTDNKRAISLYKRIGFEIEGTKKMSTFKDGKYYDDFYMSKIMNITL